MRIIEWIKRLGFLAACLMVAAVQLPAAPPEFIPRKQTKPPGPPLSPEEAIAKMTVPEGFTVELVASEPDIVNPVAMTFDEQGRIWVTESLEYPRSSPGEGRDRVKVLEDTDGDGRADKFTIFADGLNIPSGIAVGHGGVWVANAPDILFLQDTDGDLKADKREVVVTGFGRTDTHELPNSLTWGPDGFLYGLNGVFNHSHVKQNGKEFRFTCAMFRINPRTREFELFAEGTSNPWGIAWDPEGSAFISACVIDHLWHLTESGYYHRQGGPYPPFTWKLGSIVEHKHQMAAYCGIHYFDSPAYPPKYRDRLYMGNIHGGCINSDSLERRGSTYFGTGNPDFLTANDVWFMPVAQKTGPDGCLYVLDWYDRYHCYQDARRDPEGLDRLKGRLYRVRYQETPRAAKFNLAEESNEQLLQRLHDKNVFYRDIAQRILTERGDEDSAKLLRDLVLNDLAPRRTRLHALWALVGRGSLDEAFHLALLKHADPTFRAWGVRAAGNFGEGNSASVRDAVAALTTDPSADVKLQVAIASTKIPGLDAPALLLEVLAGCGEDILIPHIVWQNLSPLLETESERFLEVFSTRDLQTEKNVTALAPRMIDRALAVPETGPATAAQICRRLFDTKAEPAVIRQAVGKLSQRIQNGELKEDALGSVKSVLSPVVAIAMAGEATAPHSQDLIFLAAAWGDSAAIEGCRATFAADDQAWPIRAEALRVLAQHDDKTALPLVKAILMTGKEQEFQAAVLAALGRMKQADVATIVLEAHGHLAATLRPKAIELLTGRGEWSLALLTAIEKQQLPADSLNVNHARKIVARGDEKLTEKLGKVWGSVRTERDPQREKLIGEMRKVLAAAPGDALKGQAVFHKVCGQCHKIYGEGAEVGPDITRNGRSSYSQLLSNVFDPSLVIGAAYQALTVVTTEGRVVSGLIVEESPQRVVLKVQGGKTETIPREQIEEQALSELSLMPEGLEKQLTPQELADLFAFLCLDKPPSDPLAKRLPGAP